MLVGGGVPRRVTDRHTVKIIVAFPRLKSRKKHDSGHPERSSPHSKTNPPPTTTENKSFEATTKVLTM